MCILSVLQSPKIIKKRQYQVPDNSFFKDSCENKNKGHCDKLAFTPIPYMKFRDGSFIYEESVP